MSITNIIEQKLLKTGFGRKWFTPYFERKYARELSLLMEHYYRYINIEEGLEPYHTWDVMNLAHGWSPDFYTKITSICLYCSYLKVMDPRVKMSNLKAQRSWEYLKQPNYKLTIR